MTKVQRLSELVAIFAAASTQLRAQAPDSEPAASVQSLEGVLTMPDPEKKPPALPAKRQAPKARGDVHERGPELQKLIARGYRKDHPAYELARQNALRKKGG